MRKPLQTIFFETALNFAERSTCNRKHVGAVIVRDGRIIATGYNGSPSGAEHCLESGCLIVKSNDAEHCIRTLHAETAVISFCARKGIALEGTDLYVSTEPCLECCKLLLNAGIAKVYYLEKYGDGEGKKLLEQAGIPCAKCEI